MIKKIFLICMIGIILMLSGCSKYLSPQVIKTGNDVQYNDNAGDNDNKEPVPTSPRPASLGGICLGDSPEDIIKILGKDYKESLETDVSGYIGEDMIVWTFDRGIAVTLGKKSSKVINVVSHSADFQTDLGIKVGDEAKTAFEKYTTTFKGVKSRHSDEVIPGWFDIGDGKIVIFDFDKDNNARVGSGIVPDSSIQEIVLAYWKYFD